MDNSLLDVRDINHKYIVVGRESCILFQVLNGIFYFCHFQHHCYLTTFPVGVTPIRRTCEYNFPPFFCTALQFPTAYIPDG
ncbi:hypothetical protein DW805_02375 [Ruminococcus sp. AM32-17LB]|nr:hypothetical protein DW805_02375 [Ruminococcus sp. AM32-17LB]